ncbi:MAG TPA: Ig-like domain-containing protein [Flavobacterium sp.]|uniref:Ig-like domain-containing protein n=1 Tax=Flavobacterium sp. TaxID=239 RepID=UPI002DBB2CCD|nr:Ig-like domain-containing protein [Flavobacterium sp.]HEU4791641.1 Ig-like domain-containing protein [Flavobacterium sp.]
MNTKKLLSTIAMAVVVLISGCSKDDVQETIGESPVVTTVNPENGTINVPLTKTITVDFDQEMKTSTFDSSSFTIQGTTLVAGTVSINGKTATFSPTAPLTANTTYTGTIKTTVQSILGQALEADYVWTFSTGTTLNPMVISTNPINKATDVVLNKVIAVNFNMPMNQTTINANSITIKQGTTIIAGSVSYTGTTVYFKPNVSLMANTLYTATITTEAKNIQGTALSSNYVWTFTTGVITAPTVVSTDPLDNATATPLNKSISATFSIAIDPKTINDKTFTVKNGTTPILGVITYTGTTATFNPNTDLLPGTTYIATISGAKNMAGVTISNDYVWNFSTSSTLVGNTVNLGSAERFGILAGVGISNNAGFSEIKNMDVGISPGVRSSVTGFPPAIIVGGAIYASDDIAPPGTGAMLIKAKQDLTNAYLFAEGASTPAPATVSGDQGGKTLAPGIYKSTSTLLIQSGDLTLDAQGDANAVWIFQVASDFTTVGGAGGNVILSGGAQAKNIFWQVGKSATIGNYTIFKGNILALTSITMNSHATVQGRMLARNGSIVMTHTNIISKP